MESKITLIAIIITIWIILIKLPEYITLISNYITYKTIKEEIIKKIKNGQCPNIKYIKVGKFKIEIKCK